ncbi:MAG: hypothetical protein AAFO57_00820 [Pseudomonadota bacterium]
MLSAASRLVWYATGFLAYLAFFTVLFTFPVRAAAPCTQLVNRAEDENVIKWAIGALTDVFRAEEEYRLSTGIGDTPYWFTRSPGRFVGINCGETPFELQEMYPIGVVVKPIAVLDLPSYQRGTPILVLTEYGHRKVVPLSDIAPLAENTTYIFSDTHAEARMCLAAETCLGNYDGTCTEETCRYAITPFFGYASGPSADETLRRATRAYGEVKMDEMLMSNMQWEPETLSALSAEACKPFSVTAWREGGTAHQRRSVWFSLCQNIEERQLAGFKIVDRAWAEARFETALWGSFHRNFGTSETLFEESVRSLLNVNLISRKPCGVEVKTDSTATLGGGLGAELGLGETLKLELGANREVVQGFVRTIPDDVYLMYATYFVRPIQLDGDPPLETDLWVFDLVFRAECDDGGNPSKASSITVFYNKLSEGYETIDATEHLEKRYFKDNVNASFTANRNTAEIESGRFWFIADHIAYFKWRDTLRRFMVEDMPEVELLLERYPPAQRPIVRDFFVHLIMSAAFEYREPLRYRRPS